MWNKKQSIMLSLICTKVIIVIVAAVMIVLFVTLISPSASNDVYGDSALFTPNQIEFGVSILFAASIPALFALFCLHKLLSHIRAGEVFTAKNIRLLRVISWACFAASVIFFVGFVRCIPYVGAQPSLFIVGAFAGFAGLIMRVVKNVIDAAREIKDENDYTI